MSEKEFKVGDWVVVKIEEPQFTGIITNKTELGYVVKDNNHYYQFVLEQYMERIDPKTAFLSELSELLRKYNARINLGIRTKDRVCGVVLEVNNEGLFYPVKIEDMSNDPAIIYQMPQSNYPLTPDNILDYETE